MTSERFAPDVLEDAIVDLMNQRVRPQRPIEVGIEVERVPSRAFQPRSTTWQFDQSKLSVPRAQITVEVRRVHVTIRAPLLHRRRLRGDVEGESLRRIPHGD